MPTRRGRDLRIEYDSDDGETLVVVQRTFRDGDDIPISPVTPLLLARVRPGVPIDRRRVTPRSVRACIPNEANSSGRSLINIVVPYLPGTEDLKGQIREIRDFDNGTYAVETVEYTGEGLT